MTHGYSQISGYPGYGMGPGPVPQEMIDHPHHWSRDEGKMKSEDEAKSLKRKREASFSVIRRGEDEEESEEKRLRTNAWMTQAKGTPKKNSQNFPHFSLRSFFSSIFFLKKFSSVFKN